MPLVSEKMGGQCRKGGQTGGVGKMRDWEMIGNMEQLVSIPNIASFVLSL